MKNIWLLGLLFNTSLVAQDKRQINPLAFSGYLENYYAFDFNRPLDNNRPDFIYSFNRHNEININLGLIKVTYESQAVRANLGLMAGTYANANLAGEPGVLKNLFEANVGFKASAKKNLWLDIGIFPSHIGFESAIGTDNLTLTRSILADNSPYYESGVKVSYSPDNERWFFSALVLNGWQRIQRMDGNSFPSFGTQVAFTPNQSVTLNSSSFFGTDSPDSVRLMRYFHNLYGILKISELTEVIIGFDYGIQQESVGSSRYDTWFSPIIILRQALLDRLKLGLRGEYYDDRHGVIITTGTPAGFRTGGLSINVDYMIQEKIVWRIEGKSLYSKAKIFDKGGVAVDSNHAITTSFCFSF